MISKNPIIAQKGNKYSIIWKRLAMIKVTILPQLEINLTSSLAQCCATTSMNRLLIWPISVTLK